MASHAGVNYEVKEVEPGEYDIIVNGQVVTHHAGTPEEVDQEARRYIDHEKGESEMHDKMKKHLMEHKKLSEKDAEKLAGEMLKHHMSKMGMDEEKMSKHLEAADDKEMSRMADEHDEHMKHLAEKPSDEEKKEEEKKMAAARTNVVNLAKGIKTAFTTVSADIRMASVNARLSQLRSKGKITPAEIKKLDLLKLSSMSQEACEAALAAFDVLEPRVNFGAMSGSTKSDVISAVAKKYRMARLELETRLNMPSKRAEAQALLTKLSEAEKAELAAVGGGDEESPSKGMLTKVGYEDLVSMLEDKKRHEELKKHLKHLVDIHGDESGSHMSEEEGKRMSALANRQTELQNKFEELVSAVAPALGIKPEELKA
jgi:hypothetical protein